MKKIFITASGTEIGKTFVTRTLIHQLLKSNLCVRALKPVLTGVDKDDGASSDAGLLLNALGLDICAKNISSISPWRFKQPLSPDLAAAREGTSIAFED